MPALVAFLASAAVAGLGVGLWAWSDYGRLRAQGLALQQTLTQQGSDAEGYLLGQGADAMVGLRVTAATEADRIAQLQATRTLADYGVTPELARRAQLVDQYVRRLRGT